MADTGMQVLGEVRFPTPVGDLVVYTRGATVCGATFAGGEKAACRALLRRFGPFDLDPRRAPASVVRAIAAYLAGDLEAVTRLEVDAEGTPFQCKVWAALRRIPSGTTCSYADVARAVGAPAATRAVGLANGANPVPVIVPCHRVIRADGTIGGYGGGLARKRWLLAHEVGALAIVAESDRAASRRPARSRRAR
jgi:methylated-DNA-[protein]-cysteine S-methyltransferase